MVNNKWPSSVTNNVYDNKHNIMRYLTQANHQWQNTALSLTTFCCWMGFLSCGVSTENQMMYTNLERKYTIFPKGIGGVWCELTMTSKFAFQIAFLTWLKLVEIWPKVMGCCCGMEVWVINLRQPQSRHSIVWSWNVIKV